MHRYLRDHPDVAPVSRKAIASPGTDATMVLTLMIEVLGYGNRTRRKQLLDDIADWILSRYQAETVGRGNEYRLTVRYKTATDLEERMADPFFAYPEAPHQGRELFISRARRSIQKPFGSYERDARI